MKRLETDRLILRDFTQDDLDDFYEYAKNPKVGLNAGWPPHEKKETTQEVLNRFLDKGDVWAIVAKDSGKVIGSLGLHQDPKRSYATAKMIGYVLSEDYWGKGLMSEAVKRAIRHAFEETDTTILSVFHFSFNDRSRRVIEKCGFQYEGTLRQLFVHYDGNIYDDVCYSITKEDYTLKRSRVSG